jgi:hypothetical protein
MMLHLLAASLPQVLQLIAGSMPIPPVSNLDLKYTSRVGKLVVMSWVMDDMGFTIGHIAMNIRDMIESDPLRNELKALFARAEEISRNEIARLERV